MASDSTVPTRDRQGFIRRHWGKLALASLLLVPAALLAVWTAITMNITYSEGQRVGYAQKLSEKGWICPTWEGELTITAIPGATPEKFFFSVRSDSIARVIQQYDGQRVVLEYEQHRFVPLSCFGETEYFVSAVRPGR